MSRILLLLLVATSLAGCVSTDDVVVPPTDQVRLYRVAYEGSDASTQGSPHGWLSVVTNYGLQPTIVEVLTPRLEVDGATVGHNVVYREAPGRGEAESPDELGRGSNGTVSFLLAPGERVLLGTTLIPLDPAAHDLQWGYRTFTPDGQPIRDAVQNWTVTVEPAGTTVAPGDQVRTVTTGFFLNGEAFYTNSPELLHEANFPHDPTFVTPRDSTDPLMVYAYETEASEQPYGSADRCYTTLNDGFNQMLLQQTVGSTAITLVQPAEAYTQSGNEAHRLYGEVLVYMSTVVQHDGSVVTEDNAPDPTGACFDPLRACDSVRGETPVNCPDRSQIDTPSDPHA